MGDQGVQVDRQELSPINFLERAGDVYADRVAVVDGPKIFTWQEFRGRARRCAHALRKAGLQHGDRVALLAWNSEALLLAHFAVPLAGGVLVAMNTRLSEREIAYIVQQSGARLLFFSPELEAQCAAIPTSVQKWNLHDQWEPFLATGEDEVVDSWLVDEEETISINYTSGTTGRPKGVMYSHRGAYLNALAMALEHRLTTESLYLWTLPMFHCNGWLFPWALAAVGAQSICIPSIDT
ncbi:MAG: AMP-binding protein, partial [Pirellulales bacterium]